MTFPENIGTVVSRYRGQAFRNLKHINKHQKHCPVGLNDITRLEGQDHSSTLVSYYIYFLGVAFVLAEDCPLPCEYFKQKVRYWSSSLRGHSGTKDYSIFLLNTTYWGL